MGKAIDFLIFVNTGTDASPVWSKVAGQRSGTLNRSYETIDVTTKDSDGFIEEDYGWGTWGIDGDGVLFETDAGFIALEDAFDNAEKVIVRFQTGAGNKYEGPMIITDFPIEAPYDDTATYSLTLNGVGKPTKVTGA